MYIYITLTLYNKYNRLSNYVTTLDHWNAAGAFERN